MAAQDTKRFFWFKCDHEFFNSTKMQRLKKTKGFDLDSLSDEEKTMVSRLAMECIYLKLLAESCTHGGELLYSDGSPYDDEGLSEVLEAPESFLRATKDRLAKLELLSQSDDGTILMPELSSILESESGAALRMRNTRTSDSEHRKCEQEQTGTNGNNVPKCSRKRNNVPKTGTNGNKREQTGTNGKIVPRDQRSEIRDQKVVLLHKGVKGEKIEYPSLETILTYLENEEHLVAFDHDRLTSTYDRLVDNGWKDGGGKQVKDWRKFFRATASSLADKVANSLS